MMTILFSFARDDDGTFAGDIAADRVRIFL